MRLFCEGREFAHTSVELSAMFFACDSHSFCSDQRRFYAVLHKLVGTQPTAGSKGTANVFCHCMVKNGFLALSCSHCPPSPVQVPLSFNLWVVIVCVLLSLEKPDKDAGLLNTKGRVAFRLQ